MKFSNRSNRQQSVFNVRDEYRTNSLSLEPGGDAVIVEYADGRKLRYDKIKNVEAYTRYMERNEDVISVEMAA